MSNQLLSGEKIYLDAVTDKDLDIIVTWYRDPSFLKSYDASTVQPKTKRQLEKWMESSTNSTNQFTFAIRTKNDQRLVGFVELEGILWNQQNGWVSIAIGDSSDRNQGFGKEAMKLLIDFAFLECNLHRIQLTVFEYNIGALKLYESLGFTFEGRYREFLKRDNQCFDMLLFGLLRKEWLAK